MKVSSEKPLFFDNFFGQFGANPLLMKAVKYPGRAGSGGGLDPRPLSGYHTTMKRIISRLAILLALAVLLACASAPPADQPGSSVWKISKDGSSPLRAPRASV
jgi:hypothetical protein